MTVSDLSIYGSVTNAIEDVVSKIQTVENQLATGKSVAVPSDNPAAFAEAGVLQSAQLAIGNDNSLAGGIQSRLTVTDGALANVSNAITSAISEANQGADGSVSTAQMAPLASAVQGLLGQVVRSANLQYAGEYIFGGDQTLATPFSTTGVYSGDSGANSVSFSDGTQTQLTFNGQAVFGDNTTGVIGALTSLVSALSSGNKAAVAATLPQLDQALQQIAQVRAQIGGAMNAVGAIVTNSNATMTSIQNNLNTLTASDIAKNATDLQQQQLQEQALVSLASYMARIPLVNILA